MSSPTNNIPKLRKKPRVANKPHYEVSGATETNHSHFDEYNEYTKYKEALSNIKDAYSLVQNKPFIKYLMYLHF